MSSDSSRRFTDREVAIVLRQAAEIDETEGSGAGGGLSLEDLKEIAAEVGISTSAIEQAVAKIDRPARLTALEGAPLVRKAVRAVPGELNQDAVARLVQLIDERTDTAGSVSEALGSVRWTGADRFRSSMVSITPEAGETRIHVVEKAVARLRRIFHLVPAAYGLMLAGPVISSAGLGPALSALVAAGGVALGGGVGPGPVERAVAPQRAQGRRARRRAGGRSPSGLGAGSSDHGVLRGVVSLRRGLPKSRPGRLQSLAPQRRLTLADRRADLYSIGRSQEGARAGSAFFASCVSWYSSVSSLACVERGRNERIRVHHASDRVAPSGHRR